jgi:hypothetical protein
MRRKLAALVIFGTLAMALLVPAPTHATFPGRNGLIAFQADTGNGNQMYSVRPSGKGLRQVTYVDGEATTPDWSPDGNWIAFSLDECTVAMVHPDGSGMRTCLRRRRVDASRRSPRTARPPSSRSRRAINRSPMIVSDAASSFDQVASSSIMQTVQSRKTHRAQPPGHAVHNLVD